ncbi:MAG: DUF4442 domain-containing protein [Chitinophaga sp.]|uniref:DUF4442 domain-containing protein n=1 Tax=Chitinophaga sp. TaxID=1869181 RepID=UPI0025C5B88D|nr:DUF4442 domain-containing protein [Chitinophaga sp.]MBV8254137.1 DUF4442 domain-containing protein [Chitinophaga sp.]
MNSKPMENGTTYFKTDAVQSFIRFAQHPFKFSAFMLWKLPAAWLAGVRLVSVSEEKCVTHVPYRWLSQNPFRSTYFACLAMAGELSTGLPAMMYARSASRNISMLVTGMQATFVKKATGMTYFTCSDIPAMKAAMTKAMQENDPTTITMRSEGRNKEGIVIASFDITWSFKAR